MRFEKIHTRIKQQLPTSSKMLEIFKKDMLFYSTFYLDLIAYNPIRENPALIALLNKIIHLITSAIIILLILLNFILNDVDLHTFLNSFEGVATIMQVRFLYI